MLVFGAWAWVSFLAPLGDSFFLHSNRVYRDFLPVTHSPCPVFDEFDGSDLKKLDATLTAVFFVSLFLGCQKRTH